MVVGLPSYNLFDLVVYLSRLISYYWRGLCDWWPDKYTEVAHNSLKIFGLAILYLIPLYWMYRLFAMAYNEDESLEQTGDTNLQG